MTVYPLLIHLGAFTITGYGIMMMVAFLTAGWAYAGELRRRGLDGAIAWDTVVVAVIGGLAGSKIYYGIATGRIAAALARGGLVWYGGLVGGALAVLAYVWLKKLPLRVILDAIAPSLVIGYMLGRVGCFSVNDDYGLPSHLPWAVAFPQGSPPTTAAYLTAQFHVALPPGTLPTQLLTVQPTELYEIALSFLILWLLLRWRGHSHAPGWLFGLYLALSSLERFLVEFVRAKDDRLPGNITVAQIESLILLLVAIGLMAAWWRNRGATVTDQNSTSPTTQ